MDEASAADVNADVRDLTAGAEEHEVARHQLAAADMLAVVIILRRRRARDVEAEVAVDILHEAGAVEACGRRAAVDIVIALERQGIGHQIVRQRRLLDRAVPRRGELIAAQEDNSGAINEEMMTAMAEGMSLRQLLSFIPGVSRNVLEELINKLNKHKFKMEEAQQYWIMRSLLSPPFFPLYSKSSSSFRYSLYIKKQLD